MNVLISVNDGISLCVYNGQDYPLVDVTPENAVIACTTARSASNIALRTDGIQVETPESEFPYEVRIPIGRFDRVIDAKDWLEIIDNYFTS